MAKATKAEIKAMAKEVILEEVARAGAGIMMQASLGYFLSLGYSRAQLTEMVDVWSAALKSENPSDEVCDMAVEGKCSGADIHKVWYEAGIRAAKKTIVAMARKSYTIGN